MEKVRAKFHCQSIEKFNGGSMTAKMNAVGGNSEEDKVFNKYTPSGQLSIGLSEGTPAQDFFQPGKFYYIEFSAVE